MENTNSSTTETTAPSQPQPQPQPVFPQNALLVESTETGWKLTGIGLTDFPVTNRDQLLAMIELLTKGKVPDPVKRPEAPASISTKPLRLPDPEPNHDVDLTPVRPQMRAPRSQRLNGRERELHELAANGEPGKTLLCSTIVEARAAQCWFYRRGWATSIRKPLTGGFVVMLMVRTMQRATGVS